MFKKLLLLLILGIAFAAPAGEKRIIGSKAGGNQTLMRVDIVTKIIEYTTNGTDWFQPLLAEATTSSAGLMSSADKTKLDGLGSIPDNPLAASVSESNRGLPIVVLGSTFWTANNGELQSAKTALTHAWNMDGLTDSIGSKTLTNVGSVSFSDDGIYKKCASGFSASDYLTFESGSLATNAFSVCFRFYMTSTDMGDIFELPTPFGTLFVCPFEPSTGFYFGHRVDGQTWISDGGFYFANPSLNNWHTLIIIFTSRTSCTVYLDGTLMSLTPNSCGGTVGTRSIGAGNDGYFHGKLDELYIFDKALTADECSALYNSGLGAFITQGAVPTYAFPYLSSSTLTGDELISYKNPADSKSYYKSVSEIVGTSPVSAQAASYTLVLGDAGKLVTMNNASANTLTIPLNSSVAYPVGTWIDVSNIGTGTCTITAASSVTLNGTDGGTKDLAQWAGTRLYKIAENTWITR